MSSTITASPHTISLSPNTLLMNRPPQVLVQSELDSLLPYMHTSRESSIMSEIESLGSFASISTLPRIFKYSLGHNCKLSLGKADIMSLIKGELTKWASYNKGPFTYRRPSNSLQRCQPFRGVQDGGECGKVEGVYLE